MINFTDITEVLRHWGESGPTGDMNRDKRVDFVDVSSVMTRWLEVCE